MKTPILFVPTCSLLIPELCQAWLTALSASLEVLSNLLNCSSPLTLIRFSSIEFTGTEIIPLCDCISINWVSTEELIDDSK